MTDQQQPAIDAAKDKAIREEILRGSFVNDGRMFAFPLCFPGVTVPIAADESRITAMALGPNGAVYGGTSGHRVHIIGGLFYGTSGAVFDLGVVEGANECVAIACAPGHWLACANGPDGGLILRQALRGLPSGLIQEWGSLQRQPFDDLGSAPEGERIVDAVLDASGQRLLVATEGHLVLVDAASGALSTVGALPNRSRIARGDRGSIYGVEDQGEALWRFDPTTGELVRQAVRLPQGSWQAKSMVWANDPLDDTLFTADDEGYLFSFREETGFSPCLGQVPLMPIGTMAVTFDGRVFGASGKGMSKFFCYDPTSGEVGTMGVAVSVIERRRYGYQFGASVTGRDGEIFFGENDDLGHMWLYYPSIPKRATGAR